MKPLAIQSTHFNIEKVHKAALIAFFNIAKLWKLTTFQQQILLGNPPKPSFYKWKNEKQGCLNDEVLERISYIMGIYKALHILLPNAKAANDWLHKFNAAPLFKSQTGLYKMLSGGVADLAEIRKFLDAERY